MSVHPRTTSQFQIFKENFSKTLKTLCKSKGSINQVCIELGVNRQQFAKYLSGSTLPSIYVVQRMADYFEVDSSIFFISRTIDNSQPVIAAATPPSFMPGYYLEYSGVPSDSNESLLISAWSFYRRGAHILCVGEVPMSAQRKEFLSYRGEVKALGAALALNATMPKSSEAGIWAVMTPFEAGPTDYKAVTLRCMLGRNAEPVGSVSLFRYVGQEPDLVDLVATRCGLFPKDKFSSKMAQIWSLLIQQASVRDTTMALSR